MTSKHDSAEGERDPNIAQRAAADHARIAREQLLLQMREANERLVVAMLHADALLEDASAARAVAEASASFQSEARVRAESLAAGLQATEDSLRANMSEAQASNRAKDEFVAMLGHELRAPLAPIALALDLIAMDDDDPHASEHAMIARQLKHLVRLVDDLLDVARIRSGKIALKRLPIDLADVVTRAVELAAPLLESKHHRLSVDVPRGLVVDGDMLRLVQSANNLLTNAAKYTPTAGSIVVTGERREDTVVLRVRDSGIGISPTMLSHVFDVFAQEHQPLDRAPGGLGLGLAIVRSLVTMHGGTVVAQSNGLGHGSEFIMTLPATTSQTHEGTVVRSRG